MPKMSPDVFTHQQVQEAARRTTVTRPCPVCPESAGVFNDAQCPACHRTGKVTVTLGERVALSFLERTSKVDPKLSANNRRRYRVVIHCRGAVDPKAAPEVQMLAARAELYVWAYSSERAMITARDAALWDGVPRPFEITVSRSFLVEDEVIQKTRSTCDEDKGSTD